MESLIYLNDTFMVNMLDGVYDKILIENTLKLLSVYRARHYSVQKPSDEEAKNIIDYFINEKIELLETSPLLLTCLVQHLFNHNLQTEANLEILLSLNYQQNDYFYNYSKPSNLLSMIERAMHCENSFALLLLLLVVCSCMGTNCIIGYVLKSSDPKIDKIYEIRNFIYQVWEALNTQNYDCFERKLGELGLYNEKYSIIYKQVYMAYQENEIHYTDKRIIEYKEEFIDEP